jgi:hypothetical protein
MTKKFIAGGCSFTFGHELSDDNKGIVPSKKTWAYGLKQAHPTDHYICTAYPGTGNSGIARRLFTALSANTDIRAVVVMWSFISRYDWAMPRHKLLEKSRWASISPWDTETGDLEAIKTLSESTSQKAQWEKRRKIFEETGIKSFAESIYRYAANQYHEIYQSWKSIIWLQNILEKKKIPFMFTLADNSLFYDEFREHKEQDNLMKALHSELDLSKWYFFGPRCMGFNQWAEMEDYPRGTTHPLDEAHQDAVKLMLPTFNKLIGDK